MYPIMFNTIFADPPEGALVEIGIGKPPRSTYASVAEILAVTEWPQNDHVFFSPAVRKNAGSEKSDVWGTRVLWVDVDSGGDRPPWCIIPPSIIVASGHGWHLYWVLNEWLKDTTLIERINQELMLMSGGDNCWNVNRLLRVPESVNSKDPLTPVRCMVYNVRPYVYTWQECLLANKVRKKTLHKVRTGDQRGYSSRSERDWAVVQDLVRVGFRDDTIRHIFNTWKIGDKVEEDGGEHYISKTLEKARESKQDSEVITDVKDIDARADGYYVYRNKAIQRISTFTLEPLLLLEGDLQDAIVCNVKAGEYTWKRVTFTKKAFSSVSALDRETPLASWQWLGSDKDVRALLPYLLEQLETAGLPKTRATSILGLHNYKGSWCYVGESNTLLSSGEVVSGKDAPMGYLTRGQEHPKVLYTTSANSQTPESIATLSKISTLLCGINKPEIIWPVIGWYMASAYKFALESINVRFPILNSFGTKGSGKTTTILRVFSPLLCNTDPRSYDAGTTKFVTLALLGSNNAHPVAFSEFRQAQVSSFIRYVLLAYDTGHDPRGKSDQTTQDYPLIAPFSIDGEDIISDPAAQERMIAVRFLKDEVEEGSKHWTNFRALLELQEYFNEWGVRYFTHCLTAVGSIKEGYGRCYSEVVSNFSGKIPDRVRNNFSVCWFGITSFCDYTNIPRPDIKVLGDALQAVYNSGAGRSALIADEFVADVVNYCATTKATFPWDYDKDLQQLWFQLRPAFNWWKISKKRAGDITLAEDAVRAQMRETGYMLGQGRRRDVWMYSIDLSLAAKAGLDIPDKIEVAELRFKFKPKQKEII